MCLILCLLTKIGLKNLSNRSKITLKFLAVCKLVCTFARHLLVSREIIAVSRENILSRAKSYSVSRETISLSREIKTLVYNLARASNVLARTEIYLARNQTSSRDLKSVSREILCQQFTFWSIFCCLRPERCLFLNLLLFLVCEQS